MASVNFYIEKRRDHNGRLKKHNVPVLLYFSYDGKRLQINTGEKTDFDKWDFAKQKIIDTVPHSEQINSSLASLGDEILSIYRNAKQMGIEPGNAFMREKLKNRKINSGQYFFDVFMKFIEEKNEKWSIHTFRKIQTNYRHLRDFNENKGYIIDFDRINEDFFKKYIYYFREKGHTNSTIIRNLNVVKWFLNWSVKKGFNRNLYFRDFRFPWDHSYKADPADQYLKWDELMNLYRAELSNPQIGKARDVFCLMCFTGWKHSQLMILNKNGTIQNNNIGLRQESQELKSAHFNKYLKEILDRYKLAGSVKNAIPDIRNVSMNRQIKMAGKIAGLYQPVKIQIHNGHEKLTRVIPKYKLLSTKLARNTYIIHSLNLGVPLQHILSVTGMKTLYGIRRLYDLSINNSKPEIMGILTH